MVERMLRHEVGRQRQFAAVVPLAVLRRRLTRIVRRHERHVGEERLLRLRPGLPRGARLLPQACLFLPARLLVQKRDHRVGEQLAGERLANAPADQPAVLDVLHLDLGVIGHAAQVHRRAVIEAAQQCLFAVVPLPGDEGAVAHRLQLARQGPDAPHVVGRPHPAPAGQHHRPARHAHRTAVRAEHVVALEAQALGGQPVEVRRVDPFVAPRADRVRALVVREQEQDVRAVRRWRRPLARRRGDQRKGAGQDGQHQEHGRRDGPPSEPSLERFGSGLHRSPAERFPFREVSRWWRDQGQRPQEDPGAAALASAPDAVAVGRGPPCW